MSRVPITGLLKAMSFGAWLFLVGCQSEPEEDFSFVESVLFPLPVDNRVDVRAKHTRTIEFNCSFEEYARWLVNIEGYRESIGLKNDEDAGRNMAEIVEYLSRKTPGESYQGKYIGVDWLQEDATPPFAIQVSSHVYRPKVVSVKIVSSHL